MNHEDIDAIEGILSQHPSQCLMVGFNRRFSPHTLALKSWLAATNACKSVIITVNAGAIPQDHWTQDRAIGGGRIIGEACHFIDLARNLVDHPISSIHGTAMSGDEGRLGDCVNIQISFEDGSIATIHYLANGNKSFPERTHRGVFWRAGLLDRQLSVFASRWWQTNENIVSRQRARGGAPPICSDSKDGRQMANSDRRIA